MSRNKLRTVLTGFAVAWGIFLLVILLGAGNGLQNGIVSSMAERINNVVRVFGGQTSKPFKGYQQGRQIELKTPDARLIGDQFPDITDKVSGSYYYGGQMAVYGNLTLEVSVNAIATLHAQIYGIKISKGRFLNEYDMREIRKVVVVENEMSEVLFPKEDPIGKVIKINNVAYTVIGVSEPRFRNSGNYTCYIPISTGAGVYSDESSRYNQIAFLISGLTTPEANEAFNDRLRATLASSHGFDPRDKEAVWINNRYQSYLQDNEIFASITMFIWLIGVGTLLSGIVGVSNIMLVSVRERMNEIGIRKSLGATPFSIISMVLVEALAITLAFGYMGLVAGMGLMELLSELLKKSVDEGSTISFIFKDPTIDMAVAVSATVVLVIAGMIAGYIPARKAVKMKAIDAMRYGK